MESFKPLIAKVAAGSHLSRAEAVDAFDAILSGEVTPSQMGEQEAARADGEHAGTVAEDDQSPPLGP